MSATTGIFIELDSPVKSFFPGQLVSGCVIIETGKSVETTGLKIKFEGKAKVSWSERVTRKEGGSRKFITVFYTSEEVYFQTEILLVGSPSRQRDNALPPGRSFHRFEYLLPKDLPSSFVSRNGNVSYSMVANLALPGNRADATCNVPFTINGVLDLNLEPGASLSYDTRKYKSLYCLCCTSGPVGFLFKLPRKGYVPGEVIEFTVELSNQSNQRIYGIKVALLQVVNFHAEGNSKKTIRPIRKVQGPQVSPGDTEIWIEKMLKIPPVPPTRLATCKMIDVQYVLKVEMTLPNVSLNLKEEIPIIIGTIPLRDTFSNLSASTMNLSEMRLSDSKPSLLRSEPSLAMGDYENDNNFKHLQVPRPGRPRALSITSEHPSFVDYPDLPPPTYQEAIMLDRSPEEENRGFTPDELDNGGYAPADELNGGVMLSRMGPSAPRTFIPQYVTYGNNAPSGYKK